MSAKRSQYWPEIPTSAESGLLGYQFDFWFGLLGPVATPTAEINRIHTAMGK
jgi:tripartite-type tricarboxylate transporter receptor subunit TctC